MLLTLVQSFAAAAASPTSATNLNMKESQTLGGTSGSDSDSDSLPDIEGGMCDQSTDRLDVKRMRRYNRNIFSDSFFAFSSDISIFVVVDPFVQVCEVDVEWKGLCLDD
jgi:hypothetical protein